jgi:hypothetical protein
VYQFQGLGRRVRVLDEVFRFRFDRLILDGHDLRGHDLLRLSRKALAVCRLVCAAGGGFAPGLRGSGRRRGADEAGDRGDVPLTRQTAPVTTS